MLYEYFVLGFVFLDWVFLDWEFPDWEVPDEEFGVVFLDDFVDDGDDDAAGSWNKIRPIDDCTFSFMIPVMKMF